MQGGKSRGQKGPQQGKCLPIVRASAAVGPTGKGESHVHGSNLLKRHQDEGPQPHPWDARPAACSGDLQAGGAGPRQLSWRHVASPKNQERAVSTGESLLHGRAAGAPGRAPWH